MSKFNLTRFFQWITVTSFIMGVYNTKKTADSIALYEREKTLIEKLQADKLEDVEFSHSVKSATDKVNQSIMEKTEVEGKAIEHYNKHQDNLDLETMNEHFNIMLDKTNKVNQAMNDLINATVRRGGGSQNLLEWTRDIQNFYDTLGFNELIAFVSILGCLIIFISLLSIFFVIYSDYLIDKFKIIERFPRLKKIILLRKTFQRFYLILDFSLIIFTLLCVIYIHILMF